MNTHVKSLLLVAVALSLSACASDGGFYGQDGRPAVGSQIDRTGRPAISTALVETFNGDSAAKDMAKDAYNAATPSTSGQFMTTVQQSLAILDALDATCGNQLLAGPDAVAGRYEMLATVLVDDRLYVHTERTECGTYLGLEAEVVGAVPEGMGGCGGRTPSDDVIDRSYSVLAAGILTGVDDTITADDGAQSPTFPFLGAPTAAE